MTFLPKVFCLFLISYFLFLFLFASPIQAAVGPNTLGDFQESLADPTYNKERFDFVSLTGVISSLTTLLLGCTIDENGDGDIEFESCPESFRLGAIPLMGTAIAGIIATPPASGIQYFADVGERLKLVQPAYAQTGFGFGAIDPFSRVWRATRNIAYVFFVIAAVGFAIAIMLRTRINPQTVITIQSALPRVIIALIFVTFSYAIVGLLIDLIYVAFGLLVWGLQSGGLYSAQEAAQHFDYYRNAGFGQTFAFIFSQGFTGAWDVVKSGGALSLGVAGGFLGLVGAVIGIILAVAGAAGAAAVGVTMLPFLLGLILVFIFFTFRVLFALARAYLLLLIHLILAPLLILWGTTFGGGIWNGWLRGTMANLLVFPLVGIIIFLANILIGVVDQAGGALWAPPYVGGGVDIIKGMIALGAVMLLPTVPDVISQMLGVRGVPVQLPQAQQQIQQVIGSLSQLGGRLIK